MPSLPEDVRVAPLLWSRWTEAVASGSVRDWVVVRAMARALRHVTGPVPTDHEVTVSVTVAKAVQG